MNWPQETIDAVLQELKTSLDGLSDLEVARRLKRYGANKLPEQKGFSFLWIFIRQFFNPLIYVLIVAAVVALFFDQVADSVFIAVVIFINSVLGSYQEWHAERSSQALIKLIKIRTRVVRDGQELAIDASGLVPGDIVLLEDGGRVPADMRLVRARNLAVDESLLTGESQSIAKSVDPLPDEIVFPDCKNMAYAGSSVTRGSAVGVVVATGIDTEIGRISEAVAHTKETKPPLMLRLETFAAYISLVALVGVALLFVVGLIQGRTFFEIFFLSIALFVSVIPEGFPVAVTVALSRGAYRMSQRQVIIRRLSAVEALGSCNSIASDKTGTLTVNKQTVVRILLPSGKIFTASGVGYHGDGNIFDAREKKLAEIPSDLFDLALVGALCNEARLRKKDDAWQHHGDDVDLAFLSLAYKAGIDPEKKRREYEIKDQMPLDYELRYAAVLFVEKEKEVLGVKGAVEALLPLCGSMRVGGEIVPIQRQDIEMQAQQLAEEGYRTIAVASLSEKAFSKSSIEKVIQQDSLVFLGIVGMIDPLREEAKSSVALAKKAGVNVFMITGDHPKTALSIAKKVGIAQSSDQVVVGSALDALLQKKDPCLKDITVFARVAPLQKLEIVKMRKALGDFVAVTGDGANDAPALKEAHIGVAMGSGTDIAKEVSLIVITDDNFASIVAGIQEGRTAYANIRKVVYLLVSAGAAELLFILGSVFLNLAQPLTAVQILWLNFVTNGLQHVGLSFEPGEPFIMNGALYSSREGIFNRRMVEQVALSGFTMGFVCILYWLFFDWRGVSEFSARNYVFAFFVVLQNLHALNCKSEYRSLFKVGIFDNLLLLASIAGAFSLHVACMYIPVMSSVLAIEPLSLNAWAGLVMSAFIIIIISEIYKYLRRSGVRIR